MDASIGPFGTKEAPAVIEAYYDKRIVGCTGGDGEDKHDLVWFWLEKGKPHECRVCSQCYVLEVIGEGGPPDDEVDLEVDGEGGLHVVDHEVDGEGGPSIFLAQAWLIFLLALLLFHTLSALSNTPWLH
ncbi:cytochrome c oxidase subunit 5b-1, mitochondrial-like [Musa acuminata AAA Group]|uniref:cytochrome c oxidase subunit 5b-1, mitochondrial-like n=1 Tax=Musa acuminata AAA Group TaxID=214697 RepID=UPI0031DFC4B7